MQSDTRMQSDWRRVLVGLGSNEGDREAHLRAALVLLGTEGGVDVLRVSRLRVTAPVGGPPQEDFVNGAALLRSALAPRELLRRMQAVEAARGRVRGGPRWGPRPLDLDLLLCGDLVVEEPDLVVPHPRMAERRFVLEPAAEVAPDMVHPVLRRTVAELLEDLS